VVTACYWEPALALQQKGLEGPALATPALAPSNGALQSYSKRALRDRDFTTAASGWGKVAPPRPSRNCSKFFWEWRKCMKNRGPESSISETVVDLCTLLLKPTTILKLGVPQRDDG